MYLGYRVVCVTPAGRRRYMKLLAPYVLSSPIVDEYQIWANTQNEDDLEFFRRLALADPRVSIIEPPEVPVDGISSIGQFFRYCIDSDAVYVRFDDDVVYLGEDFFESLLRFRIENPRYFIVSPFVVNNALCSYICHTRGTIRNVLGHVGPNVFDVTGWQNPVFAHHLHNLFLHRLGTNSLGGLRFERQEFGLCRFSINCISWLGSRFAEFGGLVPRVDEEEWISSFKPAELGLTNCIHGMAIASHFAFYPQREHLDKTDLLSRYEQLCVDRFGPEAERLSGGLIEMPRDKADLARPRSTARGDSDPLKYRLDMAIQQGASWSYARSDGVLICRELRFLPDGEIAGYHHDNEHKWEISNGFLCFLTKDGQVSTRFDRLVEIDGKFRAIGCYQFDTLSFDHVLELHSPWFGLR
jgi:hypothetical protein